MASIARTPSSSQFADLLRSPGAHDTPGRQATISAEMAQREAKKQRLRELRDAHDYVGIIVNHMRRHYTAVAPPPWLDLRVVAMQLMRSNKPGAKNAAWRSLRESLTRIHDWKSDHASWRQAVQASRMPYLGSRSDIKALEFINAKEACLPKCFMRYFRLAELDFLLEAEPRSHHEIPDFWKGAEVDDPAWRDVYMERSHYSRHLPFDDDLTDLVLSTVCQKGQREPEQPPPACAGVADDEDRGVASEETGEAKKPIKSTAEIEEGGVAGLWETEVQATISRIADTVNETLATETVRLLGKRCRQETEPAQGLEKRQKTRDEPSNLQKPINTTTEASDDDGLPAPHAARPATAKDDKRYRVLKTNYKTLKDQNLQLATLYSKLEVDSNNLRGEIEQVTTRCRDLQNESDSCKLNRYDLIERCGQLEERNKMLGEKNEQLSVQIEALTVDTRKLEGKIGQISAEASALADENKIMRAQIVSLMARVDAMEQVGPPRPQAPVGGQDPHERAGRPRDTAAGEGQTHLRHHFILDGASENRVVSELQDTGRAAAVMPSPHRQSDCRVKQEPDGELAFSQDSKQPHVSQPPAPPRSRQRATSRFPRVLEMPTFDPDCYPTLEVLRHRGPCSSHQSRPTTRPNSVLATTDVFTARPLYADTEPISSVPAQPRTLLAPITKAQLPDAATPPVFVHPPPAPSPQAAANNPLSLSLSLPTTTTTTAHPQPQQPRPDHPQTQTTTTTPDLITTTRPTPNPHPTATPPPQIDPSASARAAGVQCARPGEPAEEFRRGLGDKDVLNLEWGVQAEAAARAGVNAKEYGDTVADAGAEADVRAAGLGGGQAGEGTGERVEGGQMEMEGMGVEGGNGTRGVEGAMAVGGEAARGAGAEERGHFVVG
ncbi:uncharacterized protein THITE_2090495 [Thermothielavioides terrestris NRRL 8126]|uniref:Uncharacterized protein n=1 Tax=Thermothielavioides terrestris (strain ATCC 38088 / NRRL 8126) TaxID=578455 RepID=G2RB11_THETT|nr:uncharacterized protein THITE_2090495 [Thermothielavioides terrestris NRRL 8126]AEO68982.1 hypothetical protein THITE_2090495 [Thermothielavioides terrestris NRRL 8126]